MDSKSKGLKALKDIRLRIFIESDVQSKKVIKDLKTIEKELKALEIIKNKEINVHALLLHLKRFDSPEGYNALVGEKYRITQEEYNLLKEVLL